MSIKHSTTVDIGELRTMPKPLHLMQYDKSLPEIEVSITKDGQAYEIPSSYSAEIRWGKPDRHGCTATGTISGSTVTFAVTEQMACVAGRSEVVVSLIESSSSLAGTAKFDVIVDRNPIGDNTVVSDSEIADIQKAIEAGQVADETIKKIEAAQAELDEVVEKADSASKTITDAVTTYNENVETKTTEFNSTVTQAKSDISESVSSAKTYAENAQTSATSAAESAKSASDAVSGFDTYVTEKETELDTYTASKEKSLDTYTETKKSEIDTHVASVTDDITKAKEEAVTASETATNKASEAAQSAGYASSYMDAAKTYASHAETSKDEAVQASQTATAPTLGKVLEALYASQRTGKIYGVKIPLYATSTTSDCIKTDSNEGLVCEPSTDTVEGQDDYADISLFRWMDCNYVREDDGFPTVTALEGSEEFRTEGAYDVGVVMPSFYYSLLPTDDGYLHLRVSDRPNEEEDIVTPFEACLREDGSVMPYFIFPKYFSGRASDGYLRSQPNLMPERLMSYQYMITEYLKKGTGYHGGSVLRQTLQIWMLALKYGTKNSQKKFAGVTNWNFQYALAEKSDEERTYVVVTESQANNILVGGGVSVGYTASSTDRGTTTLHAYADDVRVLSKEAQDDGNYRIYLDTDPFVTTLPDGMANVYISSMHARSGWTNAVIGKHDGSPVSNTDSKHPYRIQGLEYAVGGYEVVSDMFMNFLSDYSKDVYRCDRWHSRESSPTASTTGWTKIGNIPNSGSGADWWIGDDSFVDGAWYPSAIGGSDSLGVGDRVGAGGTSTSGTREYLMGGSLGDGSSAGSSFLYCWGTLGYRDWLILSAD